MRIDGNSTHALAARQTATEESDRKETTTLASSANQRGGAVVVSIGRAAQHASTTAARLDGEVAARLERVRRQLGQGAYPIDFDRLAERIVDDELARARR